MSQHTGARLAEVGFLLILFAGLWLTAAQIRSSGSPKAGRSSRAWPSLPLGYFSSSPRIRGTSASATGFRSVMCRPVAYASVARLLIAV
jgi:hypothetical protein